MGSLAILPIDRAPAEHLAARSWAWDRFEGYDAKLVIGVPSNEALVLGAFQRTSELTSVEPHAVEPHAVEPHAVELPRLRRGSGGGVARVGPGTVWLELALARPGALVACTADKLLNRYVRPLLRALTRATSVPTSYFGRDWISAAHRPVALVAFAHEASSGKCLFEAIVSVQTPFALAARASFLGKEPATLEEVAGRPLDPMAVADALASAYRGLATDVRELEPSPVASTDQFLVAAEPAWVAVRQEAIGTIASGPDGAGRLRVGGELMASRDAMARLDELVATLPASASVDDIGRVVDDALTAHGAVTFGVRSLASIRDVIVEARVRTSPEARSRT